MRSKRTSSTVTEDQNAANNDDEVKKDEEQEQQVVVDEEPVKVLPAGVLGDKSTRLLLREINYVVGSTDNSFAHKQQGHTFIKIAVTNYKS